MRQDFDILMPEGARTPYYLYDMGLLRHTLETALAARPSDRYKIHYAVKANSNPVILKTIAGYGLGADCVSAGEVRLALECGFKAQDIVFAGVAKTDDEIRLALDKGIGCLNVESIEELEVISEIATAAGQRARVALRVNPDIDAHTHHYITTGLAEDKFGIDRRMIDRAIRFCIASPSIELIGMHFHIGSQILTNEPYRILCERISRFVEYYAEQGIHFRSIDVGGGLGIDYDDPDAHPVADFAGYFDTLNKYLKLVPGQTVICEPGRSIVAQCGTLISRVIYVKEGVGKKFVIIDAGMNDLIRPALYQAHHHIENLSAERRAARGCASSKTEVYDVVGPICESSDTFATDLSLPLTRRGDYIAIRSAGAYGESMASTYNSRPLPGSYFY